jgi:hypothetical protein
MKMLEFLTSIAPNTINRFLSELMLNYGIGSREFESEDLLVRYVQIRRYFGYSMTIDRSLPEKEIQEEIKKIFSEYEEILIKYPDGVPDKLKAMNRNMSNKEKDVLLEKYWRRIINISLCYALVPNTHFNRPSLKDALIARVTTIIEQISAEKAKWLKIERHFWESIKKEFNSEEVTPF